MASSWKRSTYQELYRGIRSCFFDKTKIRTLPCVNCILTKNISQALPVSGKWIFSGPVLQMFQHCDLSHSFSGVSSFFPHLMNCSPINQPQFRIFRDLTMSHLRTLQSNDWFSSDLILAGLRYSPLPLCLVESHSPKGIGCLYNTSQISRFLQSHPISTHNIGWRFFPSSSLCPTLIYSRSLDGGDYDDIKGWLTIKQVLHLEYLLVPMHVKTKYVSTMPCLFL
jgi:hypothetical protein